MARGSAVMKALIFLTVSLHGSSAVTHTLQYFYTAATGINFPEFTVVGQVDGGQFVYYDSNIRKMIPKTEWIQKVNADDPDYWNRNTHKQQGHQEVFKVGVATVMQRFNQTTGVHTVQEMVGCELDDDGTVRGYDQHGYDGEDFISFELKTLSWTAAKQQAVITKNKWDNNAALNNNEKNYLQKECIEWIQKYVSYGRETLERKVRPETSLFQEEATSPEVVCHATGFFPKAVMISWKKDGKDMHEDVELRETLPNQDGSFQKRSILKVSAEELQKHTYTCVIQHSGLEKEMVLPVSERQILRGGASIALIAGVVAALVALVAVVVAGILIWKKNSDFKPVPQNSGCSSEVDSSSNNSSRVTLCLPAELREREEEMATRIT